MRALDQYFGLQKNILNRFKLTNPNRDIHIVDYRDSYWKIIPDTYDALHVSRYRDDLVNLPEEEYGWTAFHLADMVTDRCIFPGEDGFTLLIVDDESLGCVQYLIVSNDKRVL